MANALKIVVGTEKQNETGTPVDDEMTSGDKPSVAGMVIRSVYAQRIVVAAESALKNQLNYQVSLIGDTTGNYLKQSKVENAMSAVSQLASAGISIGIATLTNPLLGAVDAVVEVGSLALNAYHTIHSYNINLAKTNAASNFGASMIGDILNNGNRG